MNKYKCKLSNDSVLAYIEAKDINNALETFATEYLLKKGYVNRTSCMFEIVINDNSVDHMFTVLYTASFDYCKNIKKDEIKNNIISNIAYLEKVLYELSSDRISERLNIESRIKKEKNNLFELSMNV